MSTMSSLFLRSARVAAAIESERRRGASWLRLLRLGRLRLKLAQRLHEMARNWPATPQRPALLPVPVRRDHRG
jgi:hypothetical protein